MNMVGKKMGITGKGRCNITNSCDMAEFIKNTPGNGKFLYGAYERFSNEDLLDLLHSWGLKTKVETRGPCVSRIRLSFRGTQYVHENP